MSAYSANSTNLPHQSQTNIHMYIYCTMCNQAHTHICDVRAQFSARLSASSSLASSAVVADAAAQAQTQHATQLLLHATDAHRVAFAASYKQ